MAGVATLRVSRFVFTMQRRLEARNMGQLAVYQANMLKAYSVKVFYGEDKNPRLPNMASQHVNANLPFAHPNHLSSEPACLAKQCEHDLELPETSMCFPGTIKNVSRM